MEAIRAIAFVVRDRDWGTLYPNIDNEQISQTPTGLRLTYDAAYKMVMAGWM
ncbi:hypothetical protein [Algicella marina]|uniref:hypothetical protein n=1 Tax=Algicella marina TaxID=2683284 RepID=UPI0024DFD3B6|nr:hypothetical protein [Algicella marina]